MTEQDNTDLQNMSNQFILVLFHMKPGNILAKRCHLLKLQDILQRIANDKYIDYITIIPLRGSNTYSGAVTII